MRFIYFITFCLGLISCGQTSNTNKTQAPATSTTDSVKVFVVKCDSAKKTIVLPGELLPLQIVQIRAKVTGFIRKLTVDIGSRVKKGEILAIIDAPEVNSHIQQLNQDVQTAKAKLATSRDYFDRIDIASKKNGVIAPSEWQRVKNQMLADSSAYQGSLLAATSLRQTGSYLTVYSPIDGVVSQRNIDVGAFVGNPNDKPLFEVENNSVLRLQVAVPENYTSAILEKNIVQISSRSQPDQVFPTSLVRKSGMISSDTRTETWEFAVSNGKGQLKAGGYADVKCVFVRNKPTLTVPASAVVSTLEKRFVIKVSGGTTEWVDVRQGFNMGDKWEIFGNLHLGDTLVTKGNEELKAGTRVNVKF